MEAAIGEEIGYRKGFDSGVFIGVMEGSGMGHEAGYSYWARIHGLEDKDRNKVYNCADLVERLRAEERKRR